MYLKTPHKGLLKTRQVMRPAVDNVIHSPSARTQVLREQNINQETNYPMGLGLASNRMLILVVVSMGGTVEMNVNSVQSNKREESVYGE